jgi:Fe-only nitrogenase accessory protein AnfO
MDSIAVFVDNKGITTGFDKKGFIKVYTKKNNSWYVTDEFEFNISDEIKLQNIRTSITNMIKKITSAKILIAKKVIGQIYYILESNDFNIYEVDGQPEKFLDSVLKIELEEKEIAPIKSSNPKYIKEINNKEYDINLIEAIKEDPTLTSKKILLPYLKNKNFKLLKIYCSHVPNWIENELKNTNYKYEIFKSNKNIQISIKL